MVEPEQVIAAARALLGAPFMHRGRTEHGLDCAGLLIAVAERLGLSRPGPLYYDPLPHVGMITMLLAEHCHPVSAPEPGGVVHLVYGGRPQHLAIVADYRLGGLSLIHAQQTVGRVTEHRLDDRWQRRIVSCWRMKGGA